MTEAGKVKRALAPWVMLAAVLLITCAALVIALISDSHSHSAVTKSQDAADQAKATARCLNAVLAERDRITALAHDNEARKIADQTVAEQDQAAGLRALAQAKGDEVAGLAGFALYQKGIDEFKKALSDWQARDNDIAAQQRAHPLGKC